MSGGGSLGTILLSASRGFFCPTRSGTFSANLAMAGGNGAEGFAGVFCVVLPDLPVSRALWELAPGGLPLTPPRAIDLPGTVAVTAEPDLKFCGPRATVREFVEALTEALAGTGVAIDAIVGERGGVVPAVEGGGTGAVPVADAGSGSELLPATPVVSLAVDRPSLPAVCGPVWKLDGPPVSEGGPEISGNPEAGAGDGNEGKGGTTVLSRV